MNVEKDVVLIYYRDQPTMYARIESIEADIKKNWYLVTFLLLTLPPKEVTWILREEYINGESFTMGGVPMLIEGVKRISNPEQPPKAGLSSKGKDRGKPGKIIPFKNNP